jgi:hypothetical protein
MHNKILYKVVLTSCNFSPYNLGVGYPVFLGWAGQQHLDMLLMKNMKNIQPRLRLSSVRLYDKNIYLFKKWFYVLNAEALKVEVKSEYVGLEILDQAAFACHINEFYIVFSTKF